MHRIDTPTAQKDKFGAGKNGFTRGNPQTGTPATDLDDDYFDMLQEELAGVVEASGVNLEKSKHNQLLTALKALLLSRAHPFADIKADGAEAIAEALSNLGVGSAGGRNVGVGFSAGGSEIPDMTFFAGLKGEAGYQYFPTGMLLQWGTVTLKAAPSGTSIGTFPVAFPAAGQQIFVTHDNPLANVMAFGAASIIDPTQFRVNAIAINADTFTMAPGYSLTLRWFAIGS